MYILILHYNCASSNKLDQESLQSSRFISTQGPLPCSHRDSRHYSTVLCKITMYLLTFPHFYVKFKFIDLFFAYFIYNVQRQFEDANIMTQSFIKQKLVNTSTFGTYKNSKSSTICLYQVYTGHLENYAHSSGPKLLKCCPIDSSLIIFKSWRIFSFSLGSGLWLCYYRTFNSMQLWQYWI